MRPDTVQSLVPPGQGRGVARAPRPGRKKVTMETIADWAVLIFGIVVAFAYGYKTWLEWQDSDIDGKIHLIDTLVAAAEQMLGPRGKKLPGSARFEWVVQEYRKLFPDADLGQLRIWIEAAVDRRNRNTPEIVVVDQQISDDGGDYWFRSGSGSGRQN